MPNSPISFENSNAALVQALKEVFQEYSLTYPFLTNVRVATRRRATDNTNVGNTTNQVILSTTGSQTSPNGYFRYQGYNVSIFAKTYEEAEFLAQLTEICLTAIRGQHSIKTVTIDMAFIDVSEDSLTEERYMTCTAVLGAKKNIL
jgi:hypothetical protein